MTHPLIRSWRFAWKAEGHSDKTMAVMAPIMQRFADSHDLMTATRADCEEFIAAHPSPFMANYAWRSLRAFYKWHADEEGTVSPMAKVRAPKVPLTDVSIATDTDVSRLLRHCSPCRTMTNARDAAIVSLLWSSGLRRSELAALTLSDIDLESMTLVVRRSKNGRSRRVPFDARTAGHLARYLSKRGVRDGDQLWWGKKGPLLSDGIRLMIQRRCRAAGVSISAHSMRRGFAARALSAGVSQVSLEAIAGWAPGSTMVSRYVRMVAAETAEAEYRRLLA